MSDVTYDRPVKARLVVRLDNGDEFDAGPDDMDRFGYVDRHTAYRRLSDWLTAALERNGIPKAHDLRETGLRPVHYATECAIFYRDDMMPDERIGDEVAKLASVDIDRTDADDA